MVLAMKNNSNNNNNKRSISDKMTKVPCTVLFFLPLLTSGFQNPQGSGGGALLAYMGCIGR